MTVEANDRTSEPYECPGSETVLPYDFKVLYAADLTVHRLRRGGSSRLTLNANDQLTGVGSPNGCNVVLTVAAVAGDQYVLEGDRPAERVTDLHYDRSLRPRPRALERHGLVAAAVNSPAYYVGQGLEVIEIIEAWQLGFHLGKALKYVLRAGKKGSAVEDVLEAEWYLKRTRARLISGASILLGPMLPLTAPWQWPNVGDVQRVFSIRDLNAVDFVCLIGWIAHQSSRDQLASMDGALAVIDNILTRAAVRH